MGGGAGGRESSCAAKLDDLQFVFLFVFDFVYELVFVFAFVFVFVFLFIFELGGWELG